jgi:hypothetical protein
MSLLDEEVLAKSILSRSKIYPWVVNPYTGCQNGCSYCYARLMKRVTGHKEPWGGFVDVKINAADVLQREIWKTNAGMISLSRYGRDLPLYKKMVLFLSVILAGWIYSGCHKCR